jgi:hypothetical protein
MKNSYLKPSVQEMLVKIREKHIDVIPIILEELNNILPLYIENIVKNIYNHYNCELEQ